METVPVEEAYRAMLCFLEDFLTRGNTELQSLYAVHVVSLADGQPADPAAWNDWVRAIDRMRTGAFAELRGHNRRKQ
jgi:hypothetical protein